MNWPNAAALEAAQAVLAASHLGPSEGNSVRKRREASVSNEK
jgi:hypothetical protein